MNKSININISGGTSAISSVSQGDQSEVHGTAEITQESVDSSFAAAEKKLMTLQENLKRTRSKHEMPSRDYLHLRMKFRLETRIRVMEAVSLRPFVKTILGPTQPLKILLKLSGLQFWPRTEYQPMVGYLR